MQAAQVRESNRVPSLAKIGTCWWKQETSLMPGIVGPGVSRLKRWSP